MRYKGQAFELTVPARGAHLDETVLAALIADFHDIHRQRFSYANPGSPVEIVSLRVSAIGRLPAAEAQAARDPGRRQSHRRHAEMWLAGGWREVAGVEPRPDPASA